MNLQCLLLPLSVRVMHVTLLTLALDLRPLQAYFSLKDISSTLESWCSEMSPRLGVSRAHLEALPCKPPCLHLEHGDNDTHSF